MGGTEKNNKIGFAKEWNRFTKDLDTMKDLGVGSTGFFIIKLLEREKL